MSNADEIKKLKELLDSGVISEDEFNNEKNKLLDISSSISNPISSSNKKSKKKWFIGIGIFLILYAIGSASDNNDYNSSSSSSSNSSSSSSSNSSSSSSSNSSSSSSSNSSSSSSCVKWLSNTGSNADKMANISNNISENATDAAYGIITFSEFETYLKSDLSKVENIYYNQLSLTPNSSNQNSHDYFLTGMEYIIDGLDWAILGVETVNASYIELGTEYLLDATTYFDLATSSMGSC